MTWRIAGASKEFVIHTSEDIGNVLRRLNEEYASKPSLVEMIAPDGTTMAIGLGATVAYANFVCESGWPAYSTLGDDASHGLLHFDMGGYPTEIEGRFGVHLEQIITAAEEFFRTNALPTCIDWEEN